MTLAELRAHVAGVTYRPGWLLEVIEGWPDR